MQNSNLHTNHRKRMRERIVSNGAMSLSDHELLEVLIFSCYSRRNTNDLAHMLIDRFGSLKGVLMASATEIEEVCGISVAGSVFLQTLREFYRRIESENDIEQESFDTSDKIGNLMVKTFKYVTVEQFYMLLFDSGMHFINKILLCEGDVNSVSVDIKKLVKEAVLNNASCVIISHNHPKGKLIGSREDAILTRNIADALSTVGIELADHILVAGDRYASIMGFRYN